MRLLLPALLCLIAMVQPAFAATAPDRVLIFSKTAGFRHESIPVAVQTLQRLAAEAGMVADHSEDAALFTPDQLARYRVIVFASTTGEILDAQQQRAMEDYVRQGGGFVGVHAAADTGYEWPWYGRLVGAYFLSHPPGLQSSRVQPERDGKPAGTSWPVHDELYNYRGNPRGQVEVLATLDESRYEGGTMGADHPIAWCHRYDGGRAWYTGLGHDEAIYQQPEFLDQLRRGLAYAAGRSDEG